MSDSEIRALERQLETAKARRGERRYVVVRGQYSGAHAGELDVEDDRRVILLNSRRLWQWFGANTLSEVATLGVDSKRCKFGAPVRITILDPIEIIDATEQGRKSIEKAPEWKAGKA